MLAEVLPSSFRDPSGSVFRLNGLIHRQINHCYRDNFESLLSSGLYEELVSKHLLIPHQEIQNGAGTSSNYYKLIRPEQVRFISYPHEWCFSELRDAALATLDIQKLALERGLCLKDASAYNIQFHNGKPTLIDTLSFEKYQEGNPWVAYRQFCQHFLAPLALMSFNDFRLLRLSQVFIDGIPLDLANRLLPMRSFLRLGLLLHLHLHARTQRKYSKGTSTRASSISSKISKTSMLGLIDSLRTTILGLKNPNQSSEWGKYYSATNYTTEAFAQKLKIVQNFIREVEPKSVWDLGGNTGPFSRLASDLGIHTVCFDVDMNAVEANYIECKEKAEKHLLPLVLDLTNPSASFGWACSERMSLIERGPADLVMCLAVIHHLAISNNVPLPNLAQFFASIAKFLVIEFVPKADTQVQKLLSSRVDIFNDYTQESFEGAFSKEFRILKSTRLSDSERTVYLMQSI